MQNRNKRMFSPFLNSYCYLLSKTMVCQYGITDNSKPYTDNKQGISLTHSGPVQVVNSTVITVESCHTVELWYSNRHVDSALRWESKESYSIPGRGKRFIPSPASSHPLSGSPSLLFRGFRRLFPQGERWSFLRFNGGVPPLSHMRSYLT
jgi:hypothetical protein